MAETTVTLESTLSALIEGKKYATLRDILVTMNPADVAAVFEETDELALPLLFRLLPKELAAETFVEMQPEQQELLIRGFSDTELKEVVDELYVDDAVDLVEEMPANVVKRILRQADPDMRRMINEILRYPEDSAGSIMTTEFVSLRPQMTVEEATKRIKRTGVDKETINTCYVIDKGRLIGALSLRTLILSDDDDVIEDIMEPNVISVTTSEDQETVAQMFSKYNFNALPVVDTENRLVGIVTVDDAIDVMEEEATEDIEKMAGMAPSERPYLYTSVVETWKARIPWLLILMLSATFTGLIINHFQNQLAACLVLSSFDALRHRRQQRHAGVRRRHPRSCARRDRVFRSLGGHLEGDPRECPLRRVPRGREFRQNDARGQPAASQRRHRARRGGRVSDARVRRVHRKARRLLAADPRGKAGV